MVGAVDIKAVGAVLGVFVPALDWLLLLEQHTPLRLDQVALEEMMMLVILVVTQYLARLHLLEEEVVEADSLLQHTQQKPAALVVVVVGNQHPLALLAIHHQLIQAKGIAVEAAAVEAVEAAAEAALLPQDLMAFFHHKQVVMEEMELRQLFQVHL